MASSTLAIPTSYHKPTPALRKSKVDANKVRGEDELLKFFLHGSYDVQRGSTKTSSSSSTSSTNVSVPILTEENPEKSLCLGDETDRVVNPTGHDDQTSKSRCMFEETYMINISVKQPDSAPSSKQIDVRIEKTPSDHVIAEEKIDDDEVSSIFDEDDNDDIDSVVFNEITPTIPEPPTAPLTLADMINKTLTTIPPKSSDAVKKVSTTTQWVLDKPVEEMKASIEKKRITPPPPAPPAPLSTPTLTTNLAEDEKLFEYLDYLETKEESKVKNKKEPVKEVPSVSKPALAEPIPIIDLEQLCRSLTVHDLKDEAIRRKIYELKLLIDARHEKPKSQIPIVKPRKDPLPVLIAMPAAPPQRRRTTVVQTNQLLQSKTVNFQGPFYEIHSNPIPKQVPPIHHPTPYARRTNAMGNARKYQFT